MGAYCKSANALGTNATGGSLFYGYDVFGSSCRGLWNDLLFSWA